MPEAPLTASRARPADRRGGAVELRGVAKSFGRHRVLHHIDLTIAPGSFVAVVGRSGCGKSTLLRLVAGLEPPCAGEVEVDGAPARRGRDSRIMFQEPRLLPWARVAANVAVGLPAGSDATRVAEALTQVGLADRAGAWPAILSGGQKQRVALARALIGRPRLLALDEPLGALDALTRIGMQSLIEQCWRDQGFTALLVTHDVDEAVALADRVLVLEDGGVTEDVAVTLPRPRRRGDPGFARLAGGILDRLLRGA